MAPKFILVAQDATAEGAEQLGGSFIGLKYDCIKDSISFSFLASFKREGKGGQKIEVKSSSEELGRFKGGKEVLSLRSCLSYIMGIHDPLVMQGKLLQRKTHTVVGG